MARWWKYVFNTFDEDELYDLAADPHELRNLAGEPHCRAVLESMAGQMWQKYRETDDWNMLQAQYGMFRFAGRPGGVSVMLNGSIRHVRRSFKAANQPTLSTHPKPVKHLVWY